MAENVFDIGVGTGVDTSGLEKGLDEAQKKILDETAKLTQETEKAAQEQIDIIKETEKKKIEEIQKSIEEQIRLAKEKPGLDPSVLKAEIDAIKQAGNARIKETQTSSQLEQQIVSNAAKTKIKILQDYAKKQVTTLKDGNKKSLQSIKDFTKGAVGELMGLDQVLSSIAGGPVALGKLFVDMGKKAVAALNEAAGAWREQEQAEVALTNAAKNNPYLNDRAVKQLNQFASEMQRMAGLDSVMITQTQTRLASLGRNQQQIKDILKVAADMAASGVMDFDSAVNELNNSLNGMVKTSGRLYPELKNLSKEALASGQAIEIIGQKVAGSAAEAMKTGAGSVKAYGNAVGDLKKMIGEGWENTIRPMRDALTDLITGYTETTNLIREFERLKGKSLAEGLTDTQEQIDYINAQLAVFEDDSTSAVRAFNSLVSAEIAGFKNLHKGGLFVFIEQAKVLGKGTKEIFDELMLNKDEYKQQLMAEKTVLEEINAKERELETLKKRATEAERLAGEEILKSQQAYTALVGAAWALKNNNMAAYEAAKNTATALAEQAEAEAKLISDRKEKERQQREAAKTIRDNLEKEIAAIKEQAKLEKKSLNSAEVRTQILNARKNAYINLVKEIGSAGAAEQKTLAQLQAESYSLAVESANKLTEDNEKNLKNQIKWIEKKAEAEGKATKNIEVQKEIIDAQVNAYSNQLKILQDLIDGTGEEETARRKALQAQWNQYRNELQTAEAQKKRLDEAIKKQEELNDKIKEAQDIIKKSDYEYGLKALLAARKEAASGTDIKETVEKVNAANRAIVEYRLASMKEGLAKELNLIAKQIDEIEKKQQEAATQKAAAAMAADKAARDAITAREDAGNKRRRADELAAQKADAERAKSRLEEEANNARTRAEAAANATIRAGLIAAAAAKEREARAASARADEIAGIEAAAKAEAVRAENAVKAAEGIAAARAEAVKLADTSDANKKIEELGKAANDLKKAFNAKNAEAMRTVYDQMFDAVTGPRRAEQIRNLAKDQIAALEEMEEEELRMVGDKEEERLAIKNKYKLMLEEVDKSMNETIQRHTLDMYDKIAAGAQKVFDALSSIANNISAMLINNIDYETNEKLIANDKIIQSDEERAAAEKEIQIEAAQQRYKAELFAWQANVTMATAQAAMATLTAYTEGLKGGGPAAPIIAALQAALATAVGAMQVAAVFSARPKPPRFHSGGVVEGTGEKSAILKGGEVVQTQSQFKNTMQAINNLANTRTGTGVQMNVKIENNASNKVSATPQMTADGFKVVIKEIVNQGFSDGTFDHGIAAQQANREGKRVL